MIRTPLATTSWNSGKESTQTLQKTYFRNAPCWQTKDNLAKCNSKRYEKPQWNLTATICTCSRNSRRRHEQTWKTVFWDKSLWTEMADIIMCVRQTNVHYIYITYIRITEIGEVLKYFATTRSCSLWFPTVQLPIFLAIYSKIILKVLATFNLRKD